MNAAAPRRDEQGCGSWNCNADPLSGKDHLRSQSMAARSRYRHLENDQSVFPAEFGSAKAISGIIRRQLASGEGHSNLEL